jgi:hypothetical protein
MSKKYQVACIITIPAASYSEAVNYVEKIVEDLVIEVSKKSTYDLSKRSKDRETGPANSLDCVSNSFKEELEQSLLDISNMSQAEFDIVYDFEFDDEGQRIIYLPSEDGEEIK